MSLTHPSLPFKSVAAALCFCALLGPIGLLYASFWGGVLMIPVGLVVVCARYTFPIVLVWLFCCIWGVRAVETYNRRLIATKQ